MTITTPALVPVTAAAYLRLDVTTGLADVIHGAQVACILDDHLHAGHDITPGTTLIQTRDAAGRSVQYVAVRHYGVGRDTADRYTFSTLPDGRTVQPRGPVTAVEMRKRTSSARGEVYTLANGTVVSLYAGRCAARWVPLAETFEESR